MSKPDSPQNPLVGDAEKLRAAAATDKNTNEALAAARAAIEAADKTVEQAKEIPPATTKAEALRFAHAAKEAAEAAQTQANAAVKAGKAAEIAKEPGRGKAVAPVRDALQKANAAQPIADLAMKLANAKPS